MLIHILCITPPAIVRNVSNPSLRTSSLTCSPMLSICDDNLSIVCVVRTGILWGIEGMQPGLSANGQDAGDGDIEGISVLKSMIWVPRAVSWIVSNVSISPNSLALEKTNMEPTSCTIVFPAKLKWQNNPRQNFLMAHDEQTLGLKLKKMPKLVLEKQNTLRRAM